VKNPFKRLRNGALVVAMALAVVGSFASVTQATPPPTQPGGTVVIGEKKDLKEFVGTVGRASPVVNAPECQNRGCVSYNLNIDLPPSVWSKPGAVEVAIEWLTQNQSLQPYDALSLYVKQGGQLVAASDAQVGTAQSVFLDRAADGMYQILVAYNPLEGEANSPQVNFRGIAEVEFYPTNGDPVLLPDLEALPSSSAFNFNTPIPFLGVDFAPEGSSCFNSEINEQDAELCLRFGQAAVNTGRGALDFRYEKPVGETPEEIPAFQHFTTINGVPAEPVSVGDMHFHAAHDHYHLEGFSQSSLYRINSSGQAFGEPVVVGRKNGFCAADTLFPGFGLKGNGPLLHDAPRCLFPREVVDGIERYNHGIDVLWADEYIDQLPDQMLIIRSGGSGTDVADGTYEVRTVVDPDNSFVEEDDTNNCTAYRIQLSGLDTATPQVVTLAMGLPCTPLA
jgi:hypothetical protein